MKDVQRHKGHDTKAMQLRKGQPLVRDTTVDTIRCNTKAMQLWLEPPFLRIIATNTVRDEVRAST